MFKIIFKLSNLFIFLFLFNNFSIAQTAGNLTFNFTNAKPGSNASQNVFAVWIENGNGTFVKTRCRYWGSKTNDHLPSWKSKSGQNLVDATTGATLKSTSNPTAFGTKTITWNGTDVNGNVVADGTYKIQVESSWCNPEPANNQHKFLSTFTFEKSGNASTITPTDVNLTNVTITWTPSTSSVSSSDTDNSWDVYPNPANGSLTIDLNSDKNVEGYSILSVDGKIMTKGKWEINTNKKVVDLKDLNNAMYYVELIFSDGNVSSKSFVLNK